MIRRVAKRPDQVAANVKVNFCGDSIVLNWNAYNAFAALMSAIGVTTMRNYGVSGAMLNNRSLLFGTVPNISTTVLTMNTDAQLNIIFGGVNDSREIRTNGESLVIGTIDDTTDQTVYGALRVILNSLNSRYPGKPNIFITPLYCNGGTGTVPLYTDPVVAAMIDFCNVNKVFCFDARTLSGIDSGNFTSYLSAGLHPTDAGYDFINSSFATAINMILNPYP